MWREILNYDDNGKPVYLRPRIFVMPYTSPTIVAYRPNLWLPEPNCNNVDMRDREKNGEQGGDEGIYRRQMRRYRRSGLPFYAEHATEQDHNDHDAR